MGGGTREEEEGRREEVSDLESEGKEKETAGV